MSTLTRITWTCGCCHTPPLDFAELRTTDGMVSITTDHADEVDEYTVRQYGPDAALVSEQTMTGEELDAWLAAKTLTGEQVYLA